MITEERKAVLIKELRGHSVAVEHITDEYRENLELADREEFSLTVDGAPIRMYVFTAKNRIPHCPVHINIHGGGFVRKHETRDEIWSCKVADAIRGIAVDLDYSLAPEYPFPTAVDQCYAAAKWVFGKAKEWDADGRHISMGGYSAGATITAAICLKANETKDFRLALQVLGYGCFDMVTPAQNKKGAATNTIPPERANMFDEAYSNGDPEVLKNPLASPGMATPEMMTGLPTALVISAGRDMFRFEDADYE